MKVDLHIERLVLEGFAPAERRVVGLALERELGRLISARGLPAPLRESREVARIDAGRLDRARPASAGEAGRSIARSVYRGLR